MIYFEIPISASQIFRGKKKLLKLESGFDIKETFTEESREKEFWSKSRRLLRASPEKPISKSIIEENLPGAFWRLHLKSQ